MRSLLDPALIRCACLTLAFALLLHFTDKATAYLAAVSTGEISQR